MATAYLMAGPKFFWPFFHRLSRKNKRFVIRYFNEELLKYRTSIEYGRGYSRPPSKMIDQLRQRINSDFSWHDDFHEIEYRLSLYTWKDLFDLHRLIDILNTHDIQLRDNNMTHIHVDFSKLSVPEVEEKRYRAWALFVQNEEFFDNISYYKGTGGREYSDSNCGNRKDCGMFSRASKLNCTMVNHKTLEFRIWRSQRNHYLVLRQVLMSHYFVRCIRDNKRFDGEKYHKFLTSAMNKSLVIKLKGGLALKKKVIKVTV